MKSIVFWVVQREAEEHIASIFRVKVQARQETSRSLWQGQLAAIFCCRGLLVMAKGNPTQGSLSLGCDLIVESTCCLSA
jgi:hypothetical protein